MCFIVLRGQLIRVVTASHESQRPSLSPRSGRAPMAPRWKSSTSRRDCRMNSPRHGSPRLTRRRTPFARCWCAARRWSAPPPRMVSEKLATARECVGRRPRRRRTPPCWQRPAHRRRIFAWALDRVSADGRPLVVSARAAAAALPTRALRSATRMSPLDRGIGEAGAAADQGHPLRGSRQARPSNILTHCNAGWLAMVDLGTATAPIYLAHDALASRFTCGWTRRARATRAQA